MKVLRDANVSIDGVVEPSDVKLDLKKFKADLRAKSGSGEINEIKESQRYAIEKIKLDRCAEVMGYIENLQNELGADASINYVVYQTWGGQEGSSVIEGPLPNQDVYKCVVQPNMQAMGGDGGAGSDGGGANAMRLPVVDAVKVVRSFVFQM